MKHDLENMTNVPGVKADIVTECPKDQALLDVVSTVVFTGDTFPLARMPDAPANLASLGAMTKRGCGIVCVHYATGLPSGAELARRATLWVATGSLG